MCLGAEAGRGDEPKERPFVAQACGACVAPEGGRLSAPAHQALGVPALLRPGRHAHPGAAHGHAEQDRYWAVG